MRNIPWILTGVYTLFVAGAFRQSAWYYREAGFWAEIALLDRVGRTPPDVPDLLQWVQKHRPSLIERMRGWRSPRERRQAARWAS